MSNNGAKLRWMGCSYPSCQYSLWEETGIPRENPRRTVTDSFYINNICQKYELKYDRGDERGLLDNYDMHCNLKAPHLKGTFKATVAS